MSPLLSSGASNREVLKLAISWLLLKRQQAAGTAWPSLSWQTVLLYAVPAFLYWVHNNVQVRHIFCMHAGSSTCDCQVHLTRMPCLQFVQLTYMDPATYQILSNLKILTTGVLMWAVMRRQLSLLQWLALVLLLVGATTSQVISTVPVLGRRNGLTADLWGFTHARAPCAGAHNGSVH